jgi:hypothetical protein
MRALSLLLVAAYLAAAGVPCPGGPERGVARAAAAHDAHAGHAHHGAASVQVAEHAHHAGGGATASEARAADEASVAAPCPCGCGARSSPGARPARLGPLLASTPTALALPRGVAPAPPLLAAAPDAPTRSLDPVPRSAA